MASIKPKIFFFFPFLVKCQKSSELTLKHIWVNRSGLLLHNCPAKPSIVLTLCFHVWVLDKEDTPMSVQYLILLNFPHLVMNHQNDENWEVTGISKTNICGSRFSISLSLHMGSSRFTKILHFLDVTFFSQSLVLYSAYSMAFLYFKRVIGQVRLLKWTETGLFFQWTESGGQIFIDHWRQHPLGPHCTAF